MNFQRTHIVHLAAVQNHRGTAFRYDSPVNSPRRTLHEKLMLGAV
jgi:hypothetical protein